MEKLKNRIINLEGTFNFRDLGGYESKLGKQVKWGKLFRSGNLANLVEKDMEIIRELGIGKVFDLRRSDEIEEQPNPNFLHVKSYHIPVIPEDSFINKRMATEAAIHSSKSYSVDSLQLNANEMMTKLYSELVASTHAYKQVFENLLEQPDEDQAILFHCMAGKDRTGVVGALILSALGVGRERIEEDYALTNLSLEKMRASLLERRNQLSSMQFDVEETDGLLEARPSYLKAFLQKIDDNFGSVEHYLTEAIGLREQDFITLREHFLE